MENHCAIRCPVVSEAVKDATPTSKLNMAVAAVVSEKISLREAGRRFGVDHSSISKRMKKNGDVVNGHHDTTQPESPPVKPKTAGKAERDQWWADHQAGLSARKISDKYGRSRLSITKEIKRRQEAKAQPEPTPTPTPSDPTPSAAPEPTPAPTPSVPSAGSSAPARWKDDPVLDGWNGNLNELGQQIYNREVVSSRKRVQMAEQMAEFKLLLEKTMRAASKNHTVKAGRLLEADVKMVEATLQREGRPGIKQTLEAVLIEAEQIQKYASETLRILQLQEVPSV